MEVRLVFFLQQEEHTPVLSEVLSGRTTVSTLYASLSLPSTLERIKLYNIDERLLLHLAFVIFLYKKINS